MSTAVRIDPVETVPVAEVGLAVDVAYKQVRDLFEQGVVYDVAFLEDDGQILRRFSRRTPLEAWLVAWPTDANGTRRRDKQMIVCPIAIDSRIVGKSSKTSENLLRAQLAAAIAGDSDA